MTESEQVDTDTVATWGALGISRHFTNPSSRDAISRVGPQSYVLHRVNDRVIPYCAQHTSLFATEAGWQMGNRRRLFIRSRLTPENALTSYPHPWLRKCGSTTLVRASMAAWEPQNQRYFGSAPFYVREDGAQELSERKCMTSSRG